MYRTTTIALEADVKLGCTLGVRGASRVRGVVGAQVRIVGVLSGIPTPQFGVFAGWTLF